MGGGDGGGRRRRRLDSDARLHAGPQGNPVRRTRHRQAQANSTDGRSGTGETVRNRGNRSEPGEAGRNAGPQGNPVRRTRSAVPIGPQTGMKRTSGLTWSDSGTEMATDGTQADSTDGWSGTGETVRNRGNRVRTRRGGSKREGWSETREMVRNGRDIFRNRRDGPKQVRAGGLCAVPGPAGQANTDSRVGRLRLVRSLVGGLRLLDCLQTQTAYN